MKPWRNIVWALVCLQISLPGLVRHLAAIPALVAHYVHHVQHHHHTLPDTFPSRHYGSHHHKHQEKDHDNLPFHEHDNCMQQAGNSLAPPQLWQAPLPGYIPVAARQPVLANSDYSGGGISFIWKPPQLG